MAISDKLTYLNTTKGKIKNVANMTGAGIDNNTTFRNYAQALYDGYINVLKDRDTLLDNMPKLTSTGSISGAANLPIYEDKMSKLSTQATRILPSEYTQVDYIKSNGTQYINTDYSYKYNSSFELVLKFDNPKPQDEYPSSNVTFIVSRDMSISKRAISINFGNKYSETQTLFVWSGDSTTVNQNSVGSRILSKNLLTIRENTFSYGDYVKEIPLNTNTIEKPMILFGGYTISSPNTIFPFSSYDMYVYDFKLYEGDNLVRHYIPCYRNSDNEVGLYDIVNNVFYTNQGTGSFTYGSIVSIPNPDYPQEVKTVKGYRNLFDKNDTTKQLEGFVSNKVIQSYNNNTSIYIETTPGQTYTVTKKYGTSNMRMATSDVVPVLNTEILSNENLNVGLKFTYTMPQNQNYLVVFVQGTADLNTYTKEEILSGIQIVEGTEELPYVPYGTNWIYKKIIGKNLVGNANMWERGDITNGQNVNSNYYIRTTGYIRVKPSTSYYFSSLLTSANENWNIYQYDENKNFITRNPQPSSFETNISCFYVRIGARRAGGGSTDIITLEDVINYQFMLEEGSQATSYEPYKENIITLPLRDNEIAGTDTTKDEYIIDKNGHCWLNKKTKKYTFTGDEDFGTQYDSSSRTGFYTKYYITDIKIYTNGNETPPLLTPKFVSVSQNTSWKAGMMSMTTYESTSSRIYFFLEANKTTDDLKSILTNQPVYYALRTPELIDLNYNVDLTLYEGINNITNSEDMDMAIKYIKDTYE